MRFTNAQYGGIIKFLDGLKLKGRGSLGRTKLKEVLTEKNDEIGKDQMAIIEEFKGWTDKEKGQFTTDNPELNSAMDELLLQESEVEFESPFRNDFVEVLRTYDQELSGKDADIYALLYNQLLEEEE